MSGSIEEGKRLNVTSDPGHPEIIRTFRDRKYRVTRIRRVDGTEFEVRVRDGAMDHPERSKKPWIREL